MTESIIGTFASKGILLDKIALQSYDYASSMSGQYNGAQQKISELLDPCVPHTPFQANRLNIVIEHSCNSSFSIVELQHPRRHMRALSLIYKAFCHPKKIIFFD